MFNIETPHPHVMSVLAGTFVALLIGTCARYRALRGETEDVIKSRTGSLKTWWVITLILATALFLGRIGVAVLLGVVSTLGFREFVRLAHAQSAGRTTIVITYTLIPLNYLWLWLGWWNVFVVWLPLSGLLIIAATLVLRGQTQGFLKMSASLFWGLMLIVYCPSHALVPYMLPEEATAPVGAAGLFLYLLLLTEWNDIAQALVGRKLGKHHITPIVSPKKSLEGLLGGVVTTTLFAVLLAPWLTPFASGPAAQADHGEMTTSFVWPALAGVLISLGGLIGDITMSAVKRDAGVKDSGTLLPGQGGVLDRIDSLTFTAPLFAYYVKWTVV